VRFVAPVGSTAVERQFRVFRVSAGHSGAAGSPTAGFRLNGRSRLFLLVKPVDSGFEGGGGPEPDRNFFWDVDGFFGAGVEAGDRGPLAGLENPKVADTDRFADGEGGSDQREDPVDDSFWVEVTVGFKRPDQIGSVHARPPWLCPNYRNFARPD
jgi:hypothetical protein